MNIIVHTKMKQQYKEKFISIASFVLNKMLSNDDRKNLTIHIRTNSNISSDGLCFITEANDFDRKKQNNLTIVLNSNYLYSHHIYKVIAHETIHAAQFASGRLRDRPTCMVWEGKRVSKHLKYRELPEEIEAFALEGKMLGYWKLTRDGQRMKNLIIKRK